MRGVNRLWWKDEDTARHCWSSWREVGCHSINSIHDVRCVCVCRDWIGDLGGVAVHHGYHWNICVFFLSFKMVERPIPFLLYFLKNIYWLCWVLVAAHGIFVAMCEISLQHIDSNGGTPISSCSERAPEPHGFSSCSVRALKLWCVGSVVAPSHMGSLFPNQGLNPCPLHCKVSS